LKRAKLCTDNGKVFHTKGQGRRSHRINRGDIKEECGSGGRSRVQGQSPGIFAPVGDLGDEVPQKLKLFGETTHNICIKIQQTTVVAVTG